MENQTTNSKPIAVLSIILGLIFLSSLFIVEKNKLIIPTTNFILAKYFIIILIINTSVYLQIIGLLLFTGILSPYHSKDISQYDKAKHHLIGIVISAPVWVSFSSLVFTSCDKTFWKILLGLSIVFILWLFYSSIKILKGGKAQAKL